MQFITSTNIQEYLKDLRLPHLNQDMVSSGWLQTVRIDQSTVYIDLIFNFPVNSYRKQIEQAICESLLPLEGIKQVQITIQCRIRAHSVQPSVAAIPQVKNVIAVASGKGGVGKSTTAVNLALALQQHGAHVGLLDADIYGPNQPHMLGAQGRPTIHEDKTIEPLMAHGLQTMSIGYLVDDKTPMVWRGPMISAALNQLVRDTRWKDLDYLIVDLPPGTGDIQLTLAKKVPVTGVVMVTTPQDVALLDVRKGLEMFRKVDVDVLGVIENMSTHICTQCGHIEPLFGEGGGQRLASACDVPLLGQLPLSLEIRLAMDAGCPTVVADPAGDLTAQYQAIALNIAMQVATKKINYATKFPNIVVESKT